jgi:hypothetical protein
MKSLLTWHGIPPQTVGMLTEQQQLSLVAYASESKEETYHDWQNVDAVPLQPFASVVTRTANSFLQWGASIDAMHKISLISSHLEIGETTFNGDLNLHSDKCEAISKLKGEGLLSLRLLCVSSSASDFVDLTGQDNMEAILDRHRIDSTRFYEPQLLALAQSKGRVLKPRPWDVIVFDAITPHNPTGVLRPHQRVLQHAWIDMRLPDDWRSRVKCGDVPKFQPR